MYFISCDDFYPPYKLSLSLPSSFTFGFEFETADIFWKNLIPKLADLERKTLSYTGYKMVEELSIQAEINEYGGYDDYGLGGEVVTPIYTDNPEAWQDISAICRFLAENGGKVNQNCSLHINVGYNFLGSDYEHWYNFCRIIGACEPEIYRYLAGLNRIRSIATTGGFKCSFAMPVARLVRAGLKRCPKDGNKLALLNECGFNTDHFRNPNCTYNSQTMKNKSVSLKSLYEYSKETYSFTQKLVSDEQLNTIGYGNRIEFRMANGTLSPRVVQANLWLIYLIMHTSVYMNSRKSSLIDELLAEKIHNPYNEFVSLTRAKKVAQLLYDYPSCEEHFISVYSFPDLNKS